MTRAEVPMSWKILAAVGMVAVGASASAQEKPIGTITFGKETFKIVYAAAYSNPMVDAVDLEFFSTPLPAGKTFFSLDSGATAALRGMTLRISEKRAYKNGTWMYPSIGGHEKFYYFDEDDPIVLTYKSGQDRISGSIVGEDRVSGTPIKVKLTFDLPIVAGKD
jgi:hypothetical protein